MSLLQKDIELVFKDGNGNEESLIVTIQQLGTTKALKYSVHLGRWTAAAAAGIERKGKTVLDWNINYEKLSLAIIGQLDDDTPKLLQDLVKDCLIKPDWTPVWWDATFSGHLDQLTLLLGEILQHNWGSLGDFLGKEILDSMGTSSSGDSPEE